MVVSETAVYHEVREVTSVLMWDLVDNMRLQDRREVTRQYPNLSVAEIVSDAVDNSVFCACATVGGKVMAIWGLVIPQLLGSYAFPWCLTTDLVAVPAHRRNVILLSRFYVRKMLEFAPILVAHVDADHVLAARWLRWLGFDTSQEITVNGFKFRQAVTGGTLCAHR